MFSKILRTANKITEYFPKGFAARQENGYILKTTNHILYSIFWFDRLWKRLWKRVLAKYISTRVIVAVRNVTNKPKCSDTVLWHKELNWTNDPQG